MGGTVYINKHNLPEIEFEIMNRLFAEVSGFINIDPDKFLVDLYNHRDFLRTQGVNVFVDGVVIQSFLCSIGLETTYAEVKEFFLDPPS